MVQGTLGGRPPRSRKVCIKRRAAVHICVERAARQHRSGDGLESRTVHVHRRHSIPHRSVRQQKNGTSIRAKINITFENMKYDKLLRKIGGYITSASLSPLSTHVPKCPETPVPGVQ